MDAARTLILKTFFRFTKLSTKMLNKQQLSIRLRPKTEKFNIRTNSYIWFYTFTIQQTQMKRILRNVYKLRKIFDSDFQNLNIALNKLRIKKAVGIDLLKDIHLKNQMKKINIYKIKYFSNSTYGTQQIKYLTKWKKKIISLSKDSIKRK